MRRSLNHTYVSRRLQGKKKEEKKEKTGARVCRDMSQTRNRRPNTNSMRKKLCPVEHLMLVEPSVSRDCMFVIRFQLFFPHPRGLPTNRVTRLLPKNPVLVCAVSSLALHSIWRRQMEKVWRVGPICAMENLGMVGRAPRFVTQYGPQFSPHT
jgi:hypothetical protein